MTKDAQEYVNGWASMTGRSPSEVYVPLALREPKEASSDPGTVVLYGVFRGRKYALTLDVTGPSSDLATGRVSGTVREIAEVQEA